MGLSRKDIVDAIAERKFLSQREAHYSIETLIEIIQDTLTSGEDLLISNFGKFSVKEKTARKGRNPATGKSIILPPRKVITFKCSGKLRERLNKK